MRTACLAAPILLMAPAAKTEPLKIPVDGPQLICFRYSTFQLLDGERVVDFDGRMESMSIQVMSPQRIVAISESNIFAIPRERRQLLASWNKTKVYGGNGEYTIFGPADYSHGEDRLLIRLSVTTLTGKHDDASVYRRFEVRDPTGSGCKRGFSYGVFFAD